MKTTIIVCFVSGLVSSVAVSDPQPPKGLIAMLDAVREFNGP